MILVDTSVWAAHFDTRIPDLSTLLEANLILMHPFVVGEIMMGNVHDRADVFKQFERLPFILPVRHGQVMRSVETHRLYGSGVGYIDAHLLASAAVIESCDLWTRDKRLLRAAEALGVAAGLA